MGDISTKESLINVQQRALGAVVGRGGLGIVAHTESKNEELVEQPGGEVRDILKIIRKLELDWTPEGPKTRLWTERDGD